MADSTGLLLSFTDISGQFSDVSPLSTRTFFLTLVLLRDFIRNRHQISSNVFSESIYFHLLINIFLNIEASSYSWNKPYYVVTLFFYIAAFNKLMFKKKFHPFINGVSINIPLCVCFPRQFLGDCLPAPSLPLCTVI